MKTGCEQHLQESQTQLKTSGLKVTQGRLAMLDVFKHATKPLSAGQIATRLKTQSIDLATVYRNLESLKRQTIIAEVNVKKDEAYYELAGTHHHHLICESCGKIVDVGNCGVHKLEYQIMKKRGFAKIRRHELEFFGLCKSCAKK